MDAYIIRVVVRSRVIHSSWSVRRTLLQHWRHISKSPAPLLVTGCIRGSAANAARVSGAWFLVRRHALYQGLTQKMFSSDRHYRRTNPVPEDDGNPDPRESWTWSQLLPGILIGILYFLASSPSPIPEISFPYFLQYIVNAGEVSKLEVNTSRDRVYIYLHPGAIINGREVRPHGPQFMMSISGVDSFEGKLNSAQNDLGIPSHSRITINYRKQSETMSVILNGFVTLAIFGGVWYLISRRLGLNVSASFKGGGFNPFSQMVRAKTTVIHDSTQISTKFSDVAGMREAKQEVMEFVDYLKDPHRFTQLGARIPKGALLHGPPGTGKTMLARAIAGESHVPFISIAGPDFVEVFAGVGSARVRDLFRQSRKNAPCILYIDEIDAVGRSRKSGSVEGHSEQENTLNQILVELDGIDPLEGVVVLASTNRVDILDQALLRPGRFDRQIAIDLPTLAERKEIFEVYLRKVVLEESYDRYSSRLAALTPGHSGADIANIVNEAALHAARELGTKVTQKDFEYAIERVIAGMEKRSGVLSPEERRVIAYHEAGHALVGWLLEHTDPVLKVSIVPRTKGLLGYAQRLPSDQKLRTTEQLFDLMCMMLGGRAAEALTFRKITTGAQDDLEKVTNLAYRQVAEFGMSPSIGNISFPIIKLNEPAKRFYSDKLASLIDKEVRAIVNEAYKRTETILKENSQKLDHLAQSLLEREVLNYKDIVYILGPLPYNKTNRTHHELEDMW